MLKGHVFSKQIFGNPMFALFINTFLNGRNGVSNNYKNGMQVTYSGSNLTIDSGAVCIQGRFLEEDTGSTVPAGTDTAYCKLVIEINLDLQNTESQFNQGVYKVVKSASSYPNLTQTNIVKNNAGIYQYELARFRINSSGITEFQDMRTFLDFNSIYEKITEEYRTVLQELENELANVLDGSDYLLKSTGGTVNGDTTFNKKLISDNIQKKDGTKAIYQDNFAIIIGEINLEANEQGNIEKDQVKITNKSISYPEGFNFNNCVVISFGAVNKAAETAKGYAYGDTFSSNIFTVGQIGGSVTRNVNLEPNNIKIFLGNFSPSQATYKYKIVLMKI